MRSGDMRSVAAVPRATVNGGDAVRVWSDRSLGGGGLPGLSLSAAADGSVTWPKRATVSDGPAPSPFRRQDGFPPAPGSPVDLAVGTVEAGVHRVLSGVVDSSSSGSDGLVESDVIDPVDQLHERVTIPPMLAIMPPRNMDGDGRFVGLSSDYVADQAMRRCGVYSTPYQPAGSAGVSVPGQGSAWPDRGACDSATGFDGTGTVRFASVPWGWAITDGDAMYEPDGSTSVEGLEIGVMVSSGHAANASVTALTGSGTLVLRVLDSRVVEVRESNVLVCSISAASSSTTRVRVRFQGGTATLTDTQGREATGTYSLSGAVANVRIQAAPGARVGGVIAANLPTNWYLDQVMTARLSAGTGMNNLLLASPAVENRDALSLLQEIAEATCRAYWWNEDGVLLWVPGDALLARTPVTTLTSRDSLVELGWSESLSSTYRSVQVSHQTPAITRTYNASATVWQGNGGTLSPGVTEEIISPPSGEDWIQVDRSPVVAGISGFDHLNRGRKTIVGGTLESDSETRWGNAYLTTSMEVIGPNAWKLTYTASPPPAGFDLQLALPDDDATSAVRKRWRNEKLPIVRAYAKTTWAEEAVTAGAGPSGAGQYQHDAGPWVQGYSGEGPGTVADFLTRWLTTPRAVFEGVRVVHDSRLQAGDVVTVRDEHAHGVSAKAIIVRLEQDTTAGSQGMSLDLFVIDVENLMLSLAEHDESMASAAFSTHQAGRPNEAMAEHAIAPDHEE